MKKLFFALAAVLFAACATDVTEDVAIEAPETLKVSFEESSRIQLQNGKTVWTEGDLVSVFYKSYENMKWKFAGKTGDRTGTLLKVSGSANEQTMDNVVVAYPYSDYYSISLSTGGLVAFLPAEQTYMADSYGVDGNIMVSQSEYKQFVLKSVCGWVKIQLTGNGEKIQSIKLKGNNGEQVAGEIYINTADATTTFASAIYSNFDNTEVGGTMLEDNTILTEVTLNCGEGVTLGKNATAFYIALPPQEFSKGLAIEIEDTEGYVMEQSTDKVVTVERNHILPMAAFEFINPTTPTTPTISANEIWYTAKEKVEPTFDDHFTFGANVVSNVWDSESKRGIITFDGDVTMIDESAFANCYKLTTITLPEGVISIGGRAFYRCGLTEFTIPDSVTSIGSEAFNCCSSLTSVTIGDSVTEIGYNAFISCSSLTAFYGKFASADNRCLIIDGVLRFFARKGLTEYTIPDSVTSIGGDAFRDCDSLTSVTIPDSVTSIGSDAFYYCSSLKKVYCYATIPPLLGIYAFNYNASGRRIYVYEECVELYKSAWSSYKDSIYSNGKNCPDTTTIEYTTNDGKIITSSELPIISNSYENGVGTLVVVSKIAQIPSFAFYNCSSLTSITIPDSVTEIGEDAFYGCTSLIAFYGKFASVDNRCLIVNGMLHSFARAGLTEYTIPDSVTSIGNAAFEGCTSLTSVTIGDSVTKIGGSAFEDCTSLTSVTIGKRVTEIGAYAFYNCKSLTSVTMPDRVTEIGGCAFRYCSSLKEVYCKPITPPGGYNMFYNNASGFKIYVPRASVDAYKAAQYWSAYADDIEPYDFE